MIFPQVRLVVFTQNIIITGSHQLIYFNYSTHVFFIKVQISK